MGAAPPSAVGGRDLDATRTLTPWRARIARAEQLARARPFVAEPLTFYAGLATRQEQLLSHHPTERPGRELAPLVPEFLADVCNLGPMDLIAQLGSLSSDEPWGELIERYWKSGGREPNDASEVRRFVIEAVLQPFAEASASSASASARMDLERATARLRPTSPTSPTSPTRLTSPTSPSRPTCPFCDSPPLLAILREEGHGARRSLQCGLCLTEWPAMRLVCCACGEGTFDKLVVFRADDVKGVRVDACESCRTYMKTIDLTEDGTAIPLVDDLATIPLDLWARANGYHRERANLLRL